MQARLREAQGEARPWRGLLDAALDHGSPAALSELEQMARRAAALTLLGHELGAFRNESQRLSAAMTLGTELLASSIPAPADFFESLTPEVFIFMALCIVAVGLIFVLPILGHATWHLYRRAVDPAAGVRRGPRWDGSAWQLLGASAFDVCVRRPCSISCSWQLINTLGKLSRGLRRGRVRYYDGAPPELCGARYESRARA